MFGDFKINFTPTTLISTTLPVHWTLGFVLYGIIMGFAFVLLCVSPPQAVGMKCEVLYMRIDFRSSSGHGLLSGGASTAGDPRPAASLLPQSGRPAPPRPPQLRPQKG